MYKRSTMTKNGRHSLWWLCSDPSWIYSLIWTLRWHLKQLNSANHPHSNHALLVKLRCSTRSVLPSKRRFVKESSLMERVALLMEWMSFSRLAVSGTMLRPLDMRWWPKLSKETMAFRSLGDLKMVSNLDNKESLYVRKMLSLHSHLSLLSPQDWSTMKKTSSTN